MSIGPEQLYEQTLVIRSQIGDEAAFAELVRIYGPPLLRFTHHMLQSPPDRAADAAQEIWITIFKGLPGLRDPSKFKPWAFRIARDRVFREYRRRKLPTLPLDDEIAERVASDAEAVTPEEMGELQQCLSLLSAEHREALVLRIFEEMSYEEIARVAGVSPGTVRSRIHYGKQALRSAWKGRTP